ncbi:hypothetical protein Tco_1253983 [Tanacetum coccineum]
MEDPNIMMEEYIQLMTDKARGRDQMFNWETATYNINTVYPREPSERNDNIGGLFINLEISKCWSLEISRWLFNTLLLTTSNWRIIRSKLSGEFPRSNSFSHII